MKKLYCLTVIFSLLVFLGCQNLAKTQQETSKIQWTEGNALTSDGSNLHWWKVESDSDWITVILHGGPDADSKWIRASITQDFIDAFGTILIYDRRGCGESQTEHVNENQISFEGSFDDLNAVLEDSGSAQKDLIVLGHSFGGSLALKYSLKNPMAKALILSSPLLNIDTEIAGRNAPDVCESLLPATPYFNEKQCHKNVYDSWIQNENYLYQNYYDDLSKLKIPTLLVKGECDLLCNALVAEKAQAAFPNLQIITVPKSSHRALFSNFNDVQDSILDFIENQIFDLKSSQFQLLR